MNNPATISAWLFKGLAVEHMLDTLERDGLAMRAATEPGALQRLMPLEDFSREVRSAAITALPGYLAFFCLENSARELVRERLSERHGSEWWTSCASNALQAKVEKRRRSEDRDRWHMKRGASEIYYTDFGDLTSLIRNNYSDFEDLFPDQNWVISRFTELESSRNIVAHNNLLEPRELDRIKLYLVDWIRQVG